ncbi:hypothetical protein OQ252_11725 [Acetobacter farinalis]|uniref:DUF2946 domain-containing protein n=1 Tax=Acetobacter farinalis TaxID=1260984 RepID=A0ABT3Q9V2_9PROT|nr:hypothetical protein [Acetobacter farinalis]MCX2562058.1 hypothetical protein [Acetobacter farinalis]NHO30662.1 hypothetical protein [Acetobacter farinalis]
MIRTQARIWIGLLACLLMQVGLLAGVSPAQAQREVQAHHAMMQDRTMPCTESMDARCMGQASHSRNVPHGDKCCHVHVAATDIPPPEAGPHPVYRPGARRQVFSVEAQADFSGTDWLPPLRPPRLLNRQEAV